MIKNTFNTVTSTISNTLRNANYEKIGNGILLGCAVLYATGYFIRSVKA